MMQLLHLKLTGSSSFEGFPRTMVSACCSCMMLHAPFKPKLGSTGQTRTALYQPRRLMDTEE